MRPRLSVVVPVRDAAESLCACLASLAASLQRDHEVVVVDDASQDASAERAAEQGARVLRLAEPAGPAAARNRGAEAAQGEHLLFVDADVCVHPDTLSRVEAVFAGDPSIDALFGSYDATPAAPNLLSQYKNLFHHFVHQSAAREAETFWSGCGAIKRAVFLELGGFDPSYTRPCIEDIELGARLRRAGRRIVVCPEIQATHLKRWTLGGMVRSDVWDRGVPWTELALREGRLPNALNLERGQRVAALCAYAFALLWAVAAWRRPALLAVPVALLLGLLALDVLSEKSRRLPLLAMAVFATGCAGAVVATMVPLGRWAFVASALLIAVLWINRRFSTFLSRARGPLFAAAVLPLHLFYYCYSGAALLIGLLRHLISPGRARACRPPWPEGAGSEPSPSPPRDASGPLP